ncbi:MAG: AmmeMemoRadiSam system protein A [Acidobacteria bacterium]|nr:AmmeMemoRadiSam system protein A [Acidobacteriota bacterium]MDW7983179.1 AmmeMemoRadiSam system protein A [Acidobacteriota bacterium]
MKPPEAKQPLPPSVRKYLVQVARESIVEYCTEGRKPTPRFPDPSCRVSRGVFVTLTQNEALRGCAGLPWPVLPLEEATIEAAVRAARDPRFPPLMPKEVPSVRLEVSVLTVPEPVEAQRALEEIRVGRDGLIVRWGEVQGLLLPQVAVRYGWDVETFLAHTCRKAGLPPEAWRWPNLHIFTFQAEIIHEGEETL